MKTLREVVRLLLISVRQFYLTSIYRMDIAASARISFGAKLDKTHPKGIHIGADSYVASGAIMFSHDFCRRLKADTYVGERCFIGANSIIMAGINIGDEVIVGSGAVVTKDIPSRCIVVGNPAKVIRMGVETTKFGQLTENKK